MKVSTIEVKVTLRLNPKAKLRFIITYIVDEHNVVVNAPVLHIDYHENKIITNVKKLPRIPLDDIIH